MPEITLTSRADACLNKASSEATNHTDKNSTLNASQTTQQSDLALRVKETLADLRIIYNSAADLRIVSNPNYNPTYPNLQKQRNDLTNKLTGLKNYKSNLLQYYPEQCINDSIQSYEQDIKKIDIEINKIFKSIQVKTHNIRCLTHIFHLFPHILSESATEYIKDIFENPRGLTELNYAIKRLTTPEAFLAVTNREVNLEDIFKYNGPIKTFGDFIDSKKTKKSSSFDLQNDKLNTAKILADLSHAKTTVSKQNAEYVLKKLLQGKISNLKWLITIYLQHKEFKKILFDNIKSLATENPETGLKALLILHKLTDTSPNQKIFKTAFHKLVKDNNLKVIINLLPLMQEVGV